MDFAASPRGVELDGVGGLIIPVSMLALLLLVGHAGGPGAADGHPHPPRFGIGRRRAAAAGGPTGFGERREGFIEGGISYGRLEEAGKAGQTGDDKGDEYLNNTNSPKHPQDKHCISKGSQSLQLYVVNRRKGSSKERTSEGKRKAKDWVSFLTCK